MGGVAGVGLASFLLLFAATRSPALDRNANQQSDVWEMLHSATGLAAGADADGDRVLNRDESTAGTDPLNAGSFPQLDLEATNAPVPVWEEQAGKVYALESAVDVAGPWTTNNAATDALLMRVRISDADGDLDGLTDWEERQIGFDPASDHTERYSLTDSQRVVLALNTMSTVTVSVVDGAITERWPDPGVIAVRRAGGLKALTVNFALTGSASRDVDYATAPGTNVTIPAGAREVWLSFAPVADAEDGEAAETIVLTLAAGSNYVVGASNSATVNLGNETDASGPSAKAAARFLIQAAFGPDADAAADPDIVPENVEEVMALGFEGWIDQQLARPVTCLLPFVDWAGVEANIPQFYTDRKEAAWWHRAMGVTNLYPGGPAAQPDPLRQRMGFALSQIFVISDRLESLGVSPDGMATYYDQLLTNAFGSYRELLFDVSTHPCMGLYLSHLMNRKADPALNRFPDENYAREIMQLFSIGLWELNQDGTRRLDTNGLPIPTYDNGDITELARVFTGLGYGGTNANGFFGAPQNLRDRMKMWDAEHDCNAKTLLNGFAIPARAASNPDTGAAGWADLEDALDSLFWHTNVAPFIGRQLIQRFVTSNPDTGYIARVSAVFNDNGSGVRGDLGAVLKAVLLDPEARDPARLHDPAFGKQREPFLRVVNFGRAFNAASAEGIYPLDNFYMDHYQEPLKAPSVFNFYLPGYQPPGAVSAAGLVGPEFQILNAGSAISAPNYYYGAVRGGLHRWGSGIATRTVKLDLSQETNLVTDVDALVRRLDLGLTGGTLEPRTFQIVRDAVERVSTGTWDWQNERAYLAIYLVVTSPEFCVMR
jgi:uncharacterized protein (DUF1800 family)